MMFRLNIIVGTLPNTLTNGTTADATQVMADFNKVVNDVNANAADATLVALKASNNQFTTVQTGVAATQAANFPIASQVQNAVFNTLSSTLGTNTITARITALPLSAYAVGQIFSFIPAQGNTGSATIAIDALGSAVLNSGGMQLVGQELGSGTALIRVANTTPAMPVVDLLNSARTLPPGVLLDYGGTVAPVGYLLCDGTSYTTAAFPALFAAIGYTWGGAGANFSVPDFRRRTLVGSGGTGTSTLGNAVGNTGGEENHLLTTAEIPSHTHPQDPGTATYSGVGAVGPANPGSSALSLGGATGATGGGGAHNTIQPSAVVMKIIKT